MPKGSYQKSLAGMFGITGFNTIEAVKGYQAAVDNLNGFLGGDQQAIKIIKQQEISRLGEVLSALRGQERELQKLIGSPEELQQRLDDWYSSGVDTFFINGEQNIKSIITTIYKYTTDQWFKQNYDGNFKTALESPDSVFQQIIDDVYQNIQTDKYGEINIDTLIREIKNALYNKGDVKKYKPSKNQFEIIIDGKVIDLTKVKKIEPGKMINVRFTGDIKSLTPNQQKSIAKLIKNIADKEFSPLQLTDTNRSIIRGIINNKISTITNTEIGADIADKIAKELDKRFVQEEFYDINRSTSSITGFLGEIYWNCFWKYLLGNKRLTTLPTGAGKVTSSMRPGKEMPIDMLLKDIGFQIKNYRITEKELTQGIDLAKTKTNKPMLLENFIKGRLQLPEWIGPLQNFLFSYGYNRVNENMEHASRDYQSVFDNFAVVLDHFIENLKMTAQNKIDRIIGIDSSFGFQLVNGKVFEEDVRFNTIYIIGKHIILASQIVEQLIYSIDNSLDSTDITLEIEPNFPEGSPDVGITYPDEGQYSLLSGINKYKISYRVNINISNLINNALNNAINNSRW